MNTYSLENLEELKKQWHGVVVEKKSHEELMKMTRAKNHPRVRSLKEKLILEICISFLVTVTIVLVAQRTHVSPWLAVGFLLCNAFFLVNNLLGFHFLRTLPFGDSIKSGIVKYYMRMKTMLLLSNIAGCIMALFIIVADLIFLDSAGDRFIFSMFLVPLSWLSFWGADKWRSRAVELRKMLKEFDE